ncbi:hypothetical protein DFH06DRAFT_1332289 [Mycena polygramma]|nr:hypothetical protein DFH06DRAFT_1332289 [Mycena polygramma]
MENDAPPPPTPPPTSTVEKLRASELHAVELQHQLALTHAHALEDLAAARAECIAMYMDCSSSSPTPTTRLPDPNQHPNATSKLGAPIARKPSASSACSTSSTDERVRFRLFPSEVCMELTEGCDTGPRVAAQPCAARTATASAWIVVVRAKLERDRRVCGEGSAEAYETRRPKPVLAILALLAGPAFLAELALILPNRRRHDTPHTFCVVASHPSRRSRSRSRGSVDGYETETLPRHASHYHAPPAAGPRTPCECEGDYWENDDEYGTGPAAVYVNTAEAVWGCAVVCHESGLDLDSVRVDISSRPRRSHRLRLLFPHPTCARSSSDSLYRALLASGTDPSSPTPAPHPTCLHSHRPRNPPRDALPLGLATADATHGNPDFRLFPFTSSSHCSFYVASIPTGHVDGYARNPKSDPIRRGCCSRDFADTTRRLVNGFADAYARAEERFRLLRYHLPAIAAPQTRSAPYSPNASAA